MAAPGATNCCRYAGGANLYQLSRREVGQPSAKRAHAAEDCRHFGTDCSGFVPRGTTYPVLRPILEQKPSLDLITAIGAAMVPVLFAFGGWQTANFIAGEVKNPARNLPRALVMGVAGVMVLYVGVNFVCVRTLGPQGLAQTTVPATAVMRVAMGDAGARLIALGIAVS